MGHLEGRLGLAEKPQIEIDQLNSQTLHVCHIDLQNHPNAGIYGIHGVFGIDVQCLERVVYMTSIRSILSPIYDRALSARSSTGCENPNGQTKKASDALPLELT